MKNPMIKLGYEMWSHNMLFEKESHSGHFIKSICLFPSGYECRLLDKNDRHFVSIVGLEKEEILALAKIIKHPWKY